MNYKLLIINPGSTSTKISIFIDENEILTTTLRHTTEELLPFNSIIEQYEFRKKIIEKFLIENGHKINSFSAIVGRGGLLKPIKSGTYVVNDNMLEDLRSCKYGEHASNLGALIAYSIAKEINVPAYIVDPVVVDELEDVARISGHPLFSRISIFHALNQKAVAREVSKKFNKKYEDLNLIVCHLGGGISIGMHRKGKVVDVNNALDGEGPFSPERSMTLPSGALAKLCFSGKYTLDQVKKMIKGEGGLVAHLGTNDARKVQEMIRNGDEKAKLIYKAMAYQVAKYIMSLFPAANGEVDAVILTGGIAYDNEFFVPWVKEYLGPKINVIVFPGELEMKALALGGLRVLKGEEEAKIYS
ncbi:MAG: butyrate kinase [Spirochaetes bacterium]|nr:butyrate kinase [Spirochaetota bacterium]